MPEISRFYGIVIRMYYNDHAPAHFHAHYAGEEAVIAIEGLTVVGGRLPPRAMGLVMEWASEHGEALLRNWQQARHGQPLRSIAGLR